MRTKCAISDAFVRDCVFAYCASVAQYVYSLPAEHCFRLRNNAISDERVRDCALSTHSVFRPLVWLSTCIPYQLNIVSDYAITQYRTNASDIAHLVRIVCSGLKAYFLLGLVLSLNFENTYIQ